jgi:hypothetical protein
MEGSIASLCAEVSCGKRFQLPAANLFVFWTEPFVIDQPTACRLQDAFLNQRAVDDSLLIDWR